jgi:G:T/U-mismatch repair DNA glycosylase
MADTIQPAPYGYTATGRIRKKALKNSVPSESSVAAENPYSKFQNTRTKFLTCPACDKDFSHRPDSHRAVWQHLLHFATVAKESKHQEAREALKDIRDRKPSGVLILTLIEYFRKY